MWGGRPFGWCRSRTSHGAVGFSCRSAGSTGEACGWRAGAQLGCERGDQGSAAAGVLGPRRLNLPARVGGGNILTADCPMPVRRVEAAPAVAANPCRVALVREPLVYAVEQAGNPRMIDDAAAPPDALLAADPPRELAGLGRVVAGRVAAPGQPHEVVGMAYFLWANPELGPMRVWLRDGARPHRPERRRENLLLPFDGQPTGEGQDDRRDGGRVNAAVLRRPLKEAGAKAANQGEQHNHWHALAPALGK